MQSGRIFYGRLRDKNGYFASGGGGDDKCFKIVF
jgi:hypothetical protein